VRERLCCEHVHALGARAGSSGGHSPRGRWF
jgi:hypothetical protein